MRLRGFLIYLLFLLPFLTELQVSAVWDSNEAFYVQTPREMADRGDWVVPYFNRQPRLNKPPLTYWLVGAAQAIWKDPVAAERGVLALVAALSLAGSWMLGRLLTGNPQQALLVLGIFATCFRFLVLSRRLLIDTLLLCCLLLALVAFARWIATREKGAFMAMAIFLSLGFLTKGPIIGLAVVSFLLYLGLSGLWKELRRAPLLLSALVSALICLPWYALLASQLGIDVVMDFFFQENLGRFTHLDFGPSRGVLYYPGVFLADFAPWSLLFLGSLPWSWQRLRQEWKEASPGPEAKGTVPFPLLFMACWIGLWLALFSLSHNKQEYYILPIYPVAACWVAGWLGTRSISSFWKIAVGVPVLLAGGIVCTLGVSLLDFSPLIWLLLLLALLFWGMALSNRWLAATTTLSLLFASCLFFFTEPLEAFRPVRDFAATIQEEAAPAARVGYFRLASPSLTVYLNQQIEEIYTSEEALELFSEEAEIWLVTEEEHFSTLQDLSSQPLQVRRRRNLLTTRLSEILIRLRDPEAASSQRQALLVRRPAR